MPQLTFSIAASADDNQVSAGPSTAYPPTGLSWAPTGTTCRAARSAAPNADTGADEYTVACALLRFATSSIPDGAAITAATLRVSIDSRGNVDSRSLTADFHAWTGSASSDHTNTAGTNAISGVALSTLPTSGSADISLTGLSGISKTGTTSLRLHISGGQPTGENYLSLHAFDHASAAEPQLIVTYSLPGAAVTGGGATVATGRKAARGVAVAIGGGSATASGRKAAQGTATVSGGGLAAGDPRRAPAPPLALEGLVLAPGAVWLRHLKLGASTDPGARQVLDRWFTPQRSAGVNGRSGFTAGQIETRLSEEGTFSLTFPNGPGDDGALHRRRFEILQKGKREPTSGGVAYAGGSYRPGDEWIEIYEEGTADPLFVGTPAAAKVTRTAVEIRGVDGYWLTKKTRETAAGFFAHTPQEVFDHYLSLRRVIRGSDLSELSFDRATTEQVTPDGRFAHVGAYTEQGAVVTLRGDGAYFRAANGPRGPANAGDSMHRFEVSLHLEQVEDARFWVGFDQLASGELKDPSTGDPQSYGDYNTGFYQHAAGLQLRCLTEYLNFSTRLDVTTAHRFAIEVRERWVFYYLDGALKGVLPRGPWQPEAPRVQIWLSGGLVSIQSFVWERLRPWMRGPSAGRDLRTPGEPPPEGLQATYFAEAAGISAERGLAPAREPVSRDLTPAVAFPGPDTFPVGVRGRNDNFSARWTGSVYLDLGNFDYRFRIRHADVAGLWIGRMRIADALVRRGSATIVEATSNWVKGGATLGGSAGPLYGQRSGWYPVVVEYFRQATAAGAVVLLDYQRSDEQRWYVAGASEVDRMIRASNPLRHWPLDEGGKGRTTAVEAISGSDPGTYVNGASSEALGPGTNVAAIFDRSRSQEVTIGNPAALQLNTFTVAAWFKLRRSTYTWSPAIVSKYPLFVIQTTTSGNIALYLPASFIYFETSRFVADDDWHRAVLVFQLGVTEGTRLYVDGEQLGPPRTANAGDHTQGWRIGYGDGHYFAGSIAKVTLWNRALTAVDIRADYDALKAQSPRIELSRLGIFDEHVRFESHYDQGKAILDTFGLQFRSEPRSLESGSFPGEIVPAGRVGRDTAYVVDSAEATDVSLDLNAEDAADTLIAEGAGLANQDVELVAQTWTFSELESHLFTAMEHDSLSEITDEGLLVQRMLSLLILRGAVWEEVAARPRGARQLVDRFPVSGELAELAWRPGDAVRLRLPELDLEDAYPRQALGVTRSLSPLGLGAPSLSFRARPRDPVEAVRRVLKTALAPQRNYQGQLAKVSGSVAVRTTMAIEYSRASLPANPSNVVAATLVVQSLGGAAPADLFVNGVDTGTDITAPGHYDLMPWLAQAGAGNPLLYAHLANGTTPMTYQVELTVRV